MTPDLPLASTPSGSHSAPSSSQAEGAAEPLSLLPVEAVQKYLNRSRASVYRYANTDPEVLNPPLRPEQAQPRAAPRQGRSPGVSPPGGSPVCGRSAGPPPHDSGAAPRRDHHPGADAANPERAAGHSRAARAAAALEKVERRCKGLLVPCPGPRGRELLYKAWVRARRLEGLILIGPLR